MTVPDRGIYAFPKGHLGLKSPEHSSVQNRVCSERDPVVVVTVVAWIFESDTSFVFGEGNSASLPLPPFQASHIVTV